MKQNVTLEQDFLKRSGQKKLFLQRVLRPFYWIDRKVDGGVSFFVRHWGKSRFMVSMAKKAQVLGLEKLYLKGPKAFFYFFMFYLVRDTILYIIIPIFFARMVD